MLFNMSHKNVEKKKKNFWKDKNTKASFKKKSGEKSGYIPIPEAEESSGVKPKFQSKCKFHNFRT